MSTDPTVVASDAHLGAAPPESERAFIDFLAAVPDLTDDLVINGDLFDFWFEYRTVVLREYFPVLRRLAKVTDAGVRIRMIGGNHDAWGGSFLRDQIGIEILEGPVVTEVGGRRAYLAHGDGLAEGDWGYRLLKSLVRSRVARSLFRTLPPDLTVPLVRRASRTEEKASDPDGDRDERAEVLRRHAERLLLEDPALELVVFGHSHVPTVRQVSPGRHYLNPGDWIHNCTYGIVSPDDVEISRWSRG